MANLTSLYHRCFISAPVGLDLGALPQLLIDHGISWEWSKDENLSEQNPAARIAAADFTLIVLNGTRADYRGVFDAGMATGLRKPVLLIQSKTRTLPIDLRQFTVVKASLANREALKFHLDLFLATPTTSKDRAVVTQVSTRAITPARAYASSSGNALEQRVYDAVVAAGGSAVSEPTTTSEGRYRPDLLAWMGAVDAELLDPVAIEIKGRVDLVDASRIEDRLLGFMTSARVKSGFILTASAVPVREQQLSSNVLWLTIAEFERLARDGRLGSFVRETRNRIMHGMR